MATIIYLYGGGSFEVTENPKKVTERARWGGWEEFSTSTGKLSVKVDTIVAVEKRDSPA